jgi:hypothetical protein
MIRMFIRKSTKKQNSSFNAHGCQILVHRRDQHEQRVRAVNTLLSNCAPAPRLFLVPILNIKQSTFYFSSPVSSLEFLSPVPSSCYTAFYILPVTPLSAVHLYVYSTVFANYHDTRDILVTPRARVFSRQGAKIFFCATNSTFDLTPTQTPMHSMLIALSSGLNQPEREPNYSSISTAEIMTAWSYIFTPT